MKYKQTNRSWELKQKITMCLQATLFGQYGSSQKNKKSWVTTTWVRYGYTSVKYCTMVVNTIPLFFSHYKSCSTLALHSTKALSNIPCSTWEYHSECRVTAWQPLLSIDNGTNI